MATIVQGVGTAASPFILPPGYNQNTIASAADGNEYDSEFLQDNGLAIGPQGQVVSLMDLGIPYSGGNAVILTSSAAATQAVAVALGAAPATVSTAVTVSQSAANRPTSKLSQKYDGFPLWVLLLIAIAIALVMER